MYGNFKTVNVISFTTDSIQCMCIFCFNIFWNVLFNTCKKSILEKNMVLPIEKFQSILLPRNAILLQQLLFKFCSIICQVVIYGGLKTKENFKLLARKVLVVAYERWWLTRGSKCSDLTWKCFVLCKLIKTATFEHSTICII